MRIKKLFHEPQIDPTNISKFCKMQKKKKLKNILGDINYFTVLEVNR